jgi:hypothetical protein
LGPIDQALIMYWHICDLWGSTNLVASTVAELDETPLYLMDDIGIVWGPPSDALEYGGLGSTL